MRAAGCNLGQKQGGNPIYNSHLMSPALGRNRRDAVVEKKQGGEMMETNVFRNKITGEIFTRRNGQEVNHGKGELGLRRALEYHRTETPDNAPDVKRYNEKKIADAIKKTKKKR